MKRSFYLNSFVYIAIGIMISLGQLFNLCASILEPKQQLYPLFLYQILLYNSTFCYWNNLIPAYIKIHLSKIKYNELKHIVCIIIIIKHLQIQQGPILIPILILVTQKENIISAKHIEQNYIPNYVLVFEDLKISTFSLLILELELCY